MDTHLLLPSQRSWAICVKCSEIPSAKTYQTPSVSILCEVLGPQFTLFFKAVIILLQDNLEQQLLRSSMEKSNSVNMDLPDVREESKWDIKAPFM